MAVDEALLGSRDTANTFQPFLRLYSWNPQTLSLGRFQNPLTGLMPGVLERWPSVRRSTGGGAIWHGDELTYSLAFEGGTLGTGNVRQTYEEICSFLLATYRSLGLDAKFAKDAELGQQSHLGQVTPACFAGKEAYDIVVDGRKLGGNAQRRDRNLVFQHGSIPLGLDWKQLARVFAPGFLPDPQQVTDLSTLGYQDGAEELGRLLVKAARSSWGVDFSPSSLTEQETDQAAALVRQRYGNPEWTHKGTGQLRQGPPVP
jgi:lipoate-protein ligase A